MRVFCFEDGGRRLIGRTDLAEDAGPVYTAPRPVPNVGERFIIGTVAHPPADGEPASVELAVLTAPGQPVELLPGWEPLAS